VLLFARHRESRSENMAAESTSENKGFLTLCPRGRGWRASARRVRGRARYQRIEH
jgi:hypothetical protein